MKKTKIFIVWCLVTSIFLMQMSVWGYPAGKEYNLMDPTTWYQKNSVNADQSLGTTETFGEDNTKITLGSAGCAIHAALAMFIRFGARVRGTEPYLFHQELKDLGVLTPTGLMDFNALVLVSKVPDSDSNKDVLVMYKELGSGSFTAKDIKEYLDKGYGILAQVGTNSKYLHSKGIISPHWVLIDKPIGDNDFMIVDTGFDCTKLSEHNPLGDSDDVSFIVWLEVYKPSDPNNKPDYLYNTTEKDLREADRKAKTMSKSKFILSEKQLVGLKIEKGIARLQSTTSVGMMLVDVDEESKLRAKELGEKINQREEGNLNKIFIIISTIFGFIMVLFGLIRMVLFISDWKVDTNLYRFVDFSKKPPFKDGAGGQTEINNHWSWVSNLVLIIFGTMIMTGQAFTMVINLLVMLQGILN